MAPLRPLFLSLLLWSACALVLVCALRFGTAQISAEVLLRGDTGLLTGRTFRALCAMAVGAALAVSGLMLQSLTGNPLADPGITGINAGAALMAVATAQFLPQASASLVMASAIAGAGLAGVVLWLLAGGDAGLGNDGIALRLPLAGLAIQALCLSLALMLILTDAESQARYLRWISGAIPPVPRGETVPLMVIGAALVAGLFVCERLSLLTLGADQSHSLGRDPRVTISLVLGLVTVLSGASVAIVGPIAFLGLLVPFAARGLAGPDLRQAYGYCIPLGAAVLMASDVAGRVIARPGEIDAGLIVAMFGGVGLVVLLTRLLPRTARARA
ncbi:putative siderophore transport system permease protein YfiZ [Pseudosulfitobacter pseudonitzschiae]|uniref:Putative siderophore transport system permease protein YfiZ n=1 Tax=Pseudosulfitobacter pseudonitzschiae TaxID=1402135 RepID=A0A221JWD3_9RHOB|nr:MULTISPECIES: iron ABC transporter permease [Roseobacteraceae]ASM71002.1 putative siderophore transport system permease protein YfiZ [Pseudosulfitobacter pseudonitzschiae]